MMVADGVPSNQTRYVGGHWATYCNISKSHCAQGVFTSLIENLGVKDVQFEELVSLDPDTIRSLR